jgi:hypothetical protein
MLFFARLSGELPDQRSWTVWLVARLGLLAVGVIGAGALMLSLFLFAAWWGQM